MQIGSLNSAGDRRTRKSLYSPQAVRFLQQNRGCYELYKTSQLEKRQYQRIETEKHQRRQDELWRRSSLAHSSGYCATEPAQMNLYQYPQQCDPQSNLRVFGAKRKSFSPYRRFFLSKTKQLSQTCDTAGQRSFRDKLQSMQRQPGASLAPSSPPRSVKQDSVTEFSYLPYKISVPLNQRFTRTGVQQSEPTKSRNENLENSCTEFFW